MSYKKIRKFFIFFIAAQIGCCLGRVLAVYNDYLRHPQLYAINSAPWYVYLIPTIVITGVMVLTTAIVYFIISFVIKKKHKDE